MTLEEKREKNRLNQKKYRESHREEFNAYYRDYNKRRYEELKKLRDFYRMHMLDD